MEPKVFHSEMDSSINVWVNGFEARFVQRTPDYFIIYLSTMKGCDQHCRMCHLTATGQTDSTLATASDLVAQFNAVMKEVRREPHLEKAVVGADKVHINYMARGEPMLNNLLLENWCDVHTSIHYYFKHSFDKKIHIRPILSTIFPQGMEDEGGKKVFDTLSILSESPFPPSIYYSMYTVNESKRKKWLPRALPYKRALTYLNYYNEITEGNLDVTNKIHFAFIQGVNHRMLDIKEILWSLNGEYTPSLSRIPFNIVRYNPYSEKYSVEVEEEMIEKMAACIEEHGHPVSIIPKVGFDVKASCGMFLEQKDLVK